MNSWKNIYAHAQVDARQIARRQPRQDAVKRNSFKTPRFKDGRKAAEAADEQTATETVPLCPAWLLSLPDSMRPGHAEHAP
jgi:hypothetical protein